MSHETYLTTHDKIERGLFSASPFLWGIAAAGLAALAVPAGLLAGSFMGVVLATGAAWSGYKAGKHIVREQKAGKYHTPPHPPSNTKELPAHRANNLDPIPELADDISTTQWRKQLAQEANNAAVRNAGHGF